MRFIVCISKVNHTYGIALSRPASASISWAKTNGRRLHVFGEQTGDVIDKFDACGMGTEA